MKKKIHKASLLVLAVCSVLIIACTEGVDESMSTAPVAPAEVQPEESPYKMGQDSADYEDGMEMEKDSTKKVEDPYE